MDMKIAARMIAVFVIGAGLTAAITALHNDEDRPDASATRIERPGGDPSSLSAEKSELGRCRDLATAALEDAACRKAWAENRRRFFQINKPTPPKSQPEAAGNGDAGINKETGRE
ncbi:putative entry exclusion protein TrbK-alt [Brucella pseudogrignonensis]|uniref:putative entry exclusion protein TrbK-alt n=1 Tax=Brucella pseudogrignonensis TaxID=419475 RepID=UPI001E3694D8|nr:putative entry exclusion protein TrbK-alt [Brucella pseudogrignonensis]MCD4512148.1 putative entry exclusion protein TrbK-alt [Brucella pseudogrignonensis]